MFSITTTQASTANGSPRVIAKGHGKQRTIASDPAKSVEQNHAAAVGTLLNVMTDDRQQAMLRHPSARKRVRVESVSDAGGKYRWTINA